MGRRPAVERDALSGGLTMQCAADWYRFLGEEADLESLPLDAEEFFERSRQLRSSPDGSYHSKLLEDQIKKWCVKDK